MISDLMTKIEHFQHNLLNRNHIHDNTIFQNRNKGSDFKVYYDSVISLFVLLRDN